MKIERAKLHVKILNKLTGDKYVITGVSDEGGKAYATKLEQDNPPELSVEGVEITERNAICFRILDDPNIPEIPSGFSAFNGLLMKGGEKVTEQGEIVVSRILGYLPGRLVLAVEPKEESAKKDGYIKLYDYELSSDRFHQMVNEVIPWPAVMDIGENRLFFSYSKTHVEEKKEEDGSVKQEEVFDCAGYLIAEYYVKLPEGDGYTIKKLAVKGKRSSSVLSKPVLNNGLVIMETMDEENLVTLLLDPKSFKEVQVPITGVSTVTQCFIYGGYLLKSKEQLVYCPEENSGENYLSLNNKDVLNALNGYDFLIDKEETHSMTRLLLADKEYHVKCIKMEKTHDRGTVISVSDFPESEK